MKNKFKIPHKVKHFFSLWNMLNKCPKSIKERIYLSVSPSPVYNLSDQL